MSKRMSIAKTEAVLRKALNAKAGGQESVTLTTNSLVRLLQHIQELHSTLRDVQVDLLPASVTSDPAKIHMAVVDALTRIEDRFGPLGTLFDEMSDVSEPEQD